MSIWIRQNEFSIGIHSNPQRKSRELFSLCLFVVLLRLLHTLPTRCYSCPSYDCQERGYNGSSCWQQPPVYTAEACAGHLGRRQGIHQVLGQQYIQVPCAGDQFQISFSDRSYGMCQSWHNPKSHCCHQIGEPICDRLQ